jgi:NarL family two-component system sensor histidine kinase YdfH
VSITESVREKVDHFKQTTGISCELEVSIIENQLPAETTDHALNILSESLTNIARHAQATQVHVKWDIQNHNLELEVRDNGKGFDADQKSSGSYGLVGMHERARLTGGMLSIESNNSGTRIQFIVGRSQ